ncbi:DoxX family protein [Parasulfitobacter algicola]|uniref:DoxX family protein n=1 Tax=Parasulfitobacter algicola TaxID=2614809 RepID=A0ABX2INL4_9RHOB|nr:DoxX family protein [Sulfitobacter algicola]NSX54477.1 DoxX family protein [Sulfitobacter algicola]
MNRIAALHSSIFTPIQNVGDWITPTLARIVFAGVLLIYYWNSAMTKLGEGFTGLFSPSFNAYAQIFPKTMEAISYDASQLGIFHWLVVVAGTWAEFILPALIVVGLLTRLAALGMIGFVAMQSLVDITGHGQAPGAWFDNVSSGIISDQRAFWVFLLIVLIVRGAGPLSLDRLLNRSA